MCGAPGPWLHQVCKGSGLKLHSPVAKQRSPQLLARLEHLQMVLDNKRWGQAAGVGARGGCCSWSARGGGRQQVCCVCVGGGAAAGCRFRRALCVSTHLLI